MVNGIQEGKSLTLAAPYDRVAGQGALVGLIFGVATCTVLSGVSAEFATESVFELTKVGSQAWTVGARIFWDDSNKRCTTVGTANTPIGVCTEAVASGAGDVLGRVKLIRPHLQSAIVAYTAGTNLTGVDGAGSNAAPLAGTETRLDAIDTAIAAIIAAMKASGQMANA